MSRSIAKYMNIKKSKRPTFWNGGSTLQKIKISSPMHCFIALVKISSLSLGKLSIRNRVVTLTRGIVCKHILYNRIVFQCQSTNTIGRSSIA